MSNNNTDNRFDFSKQLDHIAYMLNVRTKGKDYENFIINAIYTKIGDPNLIPITQQYVENSAEPGKYYLIDLYLPQLNIGVEVFEGFHEDDDQVVRDTIREEAIKSDIHCQIEHVHVCDSAGKPRSYEDVCRDIDYVVKIIKDKIDNDGPLHWESNEDKINQVIESGWFRESDKVTYPSITRIYNICGGKRTGTGGEATWLQRCYYKLNNHYKLWVPVLSIIDDTGRVLNMKKGYKNTLSADKTFLTMHSETEQDLTKEKDFLRVVFLRMKNQFGKEGIKFIGVFKLVDMPSMKSKEHIFERVATDVKIEDLK